MAGEVVVLVRQFRDEKLVETKGEEGCEKQRRAREARGVEKKM